MKKWMILIGILGLLGHAAAAENGNPATAAAPFEPLRIAVLDFNTIDSKGISILDHPNIKLDMPAQQTLNAADRASINSVMQGYVRMIDAWDTSATNSTNRWFQIQDNERNWAKWKELYNTMVKGPTRPVIIGAEYLESYLGRHPDAFQGVDASLVMAAMEQLQAQPDFPQDTLRRLAGITGATHLIYGTVSDLRSRQNSFKGYGIETKTTQYELDVVLKLADLEQQRVVYGNVYTGKYREQQSNAGIVVDNNIFQNLMTSALEQAAEDLYSRTRLEGSQQLRVTPPVFQVTIEPKGGWFFKASKAEISIDGEKAGRGGDTFAIPAGMHTIGITAEGYEPCEFDLDVQKNIKVIPELE